jgi:cytochrome c
MKAVLAVACLALAGAAQGADPAELARAKGCMGCHGVDKRLVAVYPSYKEIAAKYKGQGDAADKLTAKVRKGGAGSWGQVPMPAHPQVSEADIKAIVTWALGR